ncbi:MAG TPA: HAMP domain-containing sensor histidine kinase [Rhodanobacteraceae bacterium]|nr:HAMP domain-containing sensor histidine kinase [Rhodanobacteraceae bacterium]
MNSSRTSAVGETAERAALAPDTGIAQVIGDLAHELVNPLNAAAMSTELAKLMLARGQYDKAAEALDRIGGDCMRCARILRDAQDYLTATINQRQHGVDPIGMLDEAARMLSDRGEIISDAPMGEFHVDGDPTALRRLFTELLRNAFDHGGKRIALQADRMGDEIRIRITDDGPGVDPLHLPRIFDPFFSTRRDRHSGIGLAMARRIALAHGGSLSAQNTGQGTAFELRLPAD